MMSEVASNPSPDRAQIIEALGELMETDLPQIRAVLERHANLLLHPAAEETLRDAAAAAREAGEQKVADGFIWHANLLADCRMRGIGGVFVEIAVDGESKDLAVEIAEDLQRLQELSKVNDYGFSNDNLIAQLGICHRILQLMSKPTDHNYMIRGLVLDTLGDALSRLGEREAGISRLEEAVAAYRAALKEWTRSRVPFNWAFIQSKLGDVLLQLGQGGSGKTQLEEAVAAYRAALEERTRDRASLDWAITQNNLGNALRTLGEREDNTACLDDAVATYRAALEEIPRDRVPLDWAVTQNNLGLALAVLGERTDGTARLDEAIAAYRAALEERTRDRVPLDWATTQTNLGDALLTLCKRQDSAACLYDAVSAYRAALEVRTRDRLPLDWAKTQAGLGNALQTLGEREAGTARLEEAVAAYRAALEEVARDREPLDWSKTQASLGNALQTLGEREAGTVRLEEAVVAYRAALEEMTRDRVPLDWAAMQDDLGVALFRIGERQSGTARLKEAVVAFNFALGERTRDRVPLDWAKTQVHLGGALRRLGEREAGTASLEEAALAYRAALQELTRANASHAWAMALHNLGVCLLRLGERGAGEARYDEAVTAFRAALEVFSRDSRPLDWAMAQTNLGNALAVLGAREVGTARLEEAVSAYRAALEEWTRDRVPLDWAATQANLGGVLWELGKHESNIACRDEAVASFGAALQVLTGSSDIETTQTLRNVHARALLDLRRYPDAVAVLDAATRQSEADLLEPGWSAADRLRSITRTENLFGLLSLSHLRKLEPNPAAALAAAEAGRARLLADALAFDKARLDDIIEPEVRGMIEATRDRRDSLRFDLGYALRGDLPPPQLSPAQRDGLFDELHHAQEAYLSLCRTHGLIRTPTPIGMAEIEQAIPPGGALVLPVLTLTEAFIFVVTAGQSMPAVIEYPGLNEAEVVGLLFGEEGWLGCYHTHFTEYHGENPAAAERWHRKLAGAQAWLWERLLAPVHRHLHDVAKLRAGAPVVLLPPGLLGLLPLHAAGPGPDGSHFDDHWTVSYAPSVRSLLTCQTRRDGHLGRPLRLLGVLDPDGSLPGARAEEALLHRHFRTADAEPIVLCGKEAGLARVLAALTATTLLHAATHGTHDSLQPAQSGLVLANDRLRVAVLHQVRMDLRLAFLAACESGLAGVNAAPEEFIGLPTGFVQAGAAAVIGSLWPVGDIAAFVMADRFYELFVGPDGLERMTPAAALRDARHWLRALTYGELRQRYPVAPDGNGAELVLRAFPGVFDPDPPAPQELRLPLGADYERPFADATQWAAFACTGA
jgi:tetratricopeptide (TPR) repeat protein